ncbi:MAG TPA: DNA mismatch repair protein MutS, partial [Nannocystis exedens]|nr:DNA mismatch repair protein MutS [Nannocystis exedens]
VAVHEERGNIVFLHRLESGAAERSYGIQVGRLAGLPAQVLRRAQRILTRLEADDRLGSTPQLDLFAPVARIETVEDGEVARASSASAEPVDPVDPVMSAVLGDLRRADPDDLTPRQAHAMLRQLRERLVTSGQVRARA